MKYEYMDVLYFYDYVLLECNSMSALAKSLVDMQQSVRVNKGLH